MGYYLFYKIYFHCIQPSCWRWHILMRSRWLSATHICYILRAPITCSFIHSSIPSLRVRLGVCSQNQRQKKKNEKIEPSSCRDTMGPLSRHKNVHTSAWWCSSSLAASFAEGIDGHCYLGRSCPSEPINILLCPPDHSTHPLCPSCGWGNCAPSHCVCVWEGILTLALPEFPRLTKLLHVDFFFLISDALTWMRNSSGFFLLLWRFSVCLLSTDKDKRKKTNTRPCDTFGSFVPWKNVKQKTISFSEGEMTGSRRAGERQLKGLWET